MAPRNRDSYSARDLAVLDGLDAVRKRPGMYIGSNDSRGLMHCMWEIIDNSVDEALAGHCTRIDVELAADGSVIVCDNGRGIPVDKEPKTKLTGVQLVMTKLHAGGKFGGGSYAASGGLHGVGASVVNALSSRMDVQVDRDGKTYGMSFRRGIPGVFDGPDPESPFGRRSGLDEFGRVPKTRTGTRIRWWADRQVFTKDAEYDRELLRERALQSSFLVPSLKIMLRDARNSQVWEETIQHKGGLNEYLQYLANGQPVCSVIHLRGNGSFHETVPVLDNKGHLATQEVERDLAVDIALQWDEGYETEVRSFVNVIATPLGGTHVSGFERALVRTVNDQLKATRVLKGSEPSITKDDAVEGLTAIVTVRLAEPQFEGQTKEILGTPAVSRIVGRIVSQELGQWFSRPPRGEKAAAKAVLEKIAAAMRTRLAARAHRDTQRRKSALETSSLPAKLVDCRRSGSDSTELFIVEGDSALGTGKTARDSDFQALLPIRGKILNVQKASLADMLKNTECASIIQVLGAGSGKSFELEQVRYEKLILMSDADVDGAHIRCLLLTLIYRYLPGLIESGRVYAAVPPLHRIEVSGKGGYEVIYAYSDAEMRSLVQKAQEQGRRVKEPIQRYKGLGEMDASQLRETTMDPARRTLRRMRVTDAAEAQEVFELLMGGNVAPRKEFIVSGAGALDRARIDS